jgi:hypothetical protein
MWEMEFTDDGCRPYSKRNNCLGQQTGAPTAVDDNAAATNAATNPTTPKLTLQAWDPDAARIRSWRPRRQLRLSRNIIPIEIFGIMNLPHVVLPIITNPAVPGGTETGLGGFEFYNFSIAHMHGTTYGAPLLILPTESDTHFGSEKWQAGVAAVVLDAPTWGTWGRIFTFQHAFGRGAGPITHEETFQPIIHYNLHSGLYLQSEGVMEFNSGSGIKAIPIGLGMGKVWKDSAGRTVSVWLEPQYSVWRRGIGAPQWQLFSGVSVQIPIVFKLWSK